MDNSNIGYMVIPIDLTERQALIYMQMYKRCNFQDMTVKYTLEQLACDIKTTNIPKITIYKNIQKMIEKGYLQLVKKSSKGNSPIYRIVPIIELNTQKEGKPKVNQEKTKGKPKHSNNEGLNGEEENQEKAKGKPKDSPIKEKEKENNIYSENIAIAIKKYPGKKVKSVRDKKLPSLIKKYGEEQIIRCIDRYLEECKGKDKQYIMYESTFWNGRYIEYLDENYKSEEKPKRRLIDEII